jgi:hypothetical protein
MTTNPFDDSENWDQYVKERMNNADVPLHLPRPVRAAEEPDQIDVERFRRLAEDRRRRQPAPATTWLCAARRPRTHRALGRRAPRRIVRRAARRASTSSSDLPPGAGVYALVGGASTAAVSVQHVDLFLGSSRATCGRLPVGGWG